MSASNAVSIAIEEYAGDGTDWNRFAIEHPSVRFCHLWQYSKVIKETYGYRSYAVVAKRNETTAAVWPVYVATSVLLGRRIVSQPFTEYGGLLATDLDSRELGGLIHHMRDYGTRIGATQIEVHGDTGFPQEVRDGHFVLQNPYGLAVLKLDPDPDRLLSGVFDYQVRKALQKASRSGLSTFEDHGPEIMRRHFWPLFLRSMKRLGSPPHPFTYFSSLGRHFAGELKVFWAEAAGRPLAALLGFAVGRRIQITNIVSNEESWPLRANDLVHWEFIKWGCINGYVEFDFGSVRYEGQLRYKKKWGSEIRPSGYHVAAIRPDSPEKTFSSSSQGMRTASAIWGRCVPLWLTPMVGPVIRRQLIR